MARTCLQWQFKTPKDLRVWCTVSLFPYLMVDLDSFPLQRQSRYSLYSPLRLTYIVSRVNIFAPQLQSLIF